MARNLLDSELSHIEHTANKSMRRVSVIKCMKNESINQYFLSKLTYMRTKNHFVILWMRVRLEPVYSIKLLELQKDVTLVKYMS